MIRALVFDFDGLILDTETTLYRSWMKIYDDAGLSISETAWAQLLGASADPTEMYDILERHLGHAVDRAALRRRRMQHEMQLLQFETVLPGVEPLLADGKTRGLSLAIASSSDRAWVEGHIDRLGLRPFFEAIVCAEDVQQTKPQPDLYLSAAQRLGVAPGEAIAFEDSLHGVRAAKTAGMFCVAVPNRITRCLSFDEADLVLDSLQGSSLAEILRAAEADEARNSDEE